MGYRKKEWCFRLGGECLPFIELSDLCSLVESQYARSGFTPLSPDFLNARLRATILGPRLTPHKIEQNWGGYLCHA